MKKRLRNLIILNLSLLGVALVFYVGIHILRIMELDKCSFLTLTHLYCPGCGGTRSLEALVRLDIISSFKYNAILPLGVLVYLYYNIRSLVAIIKKDEKYFRKVNYSLAVVWSAFVGIYFILRNVLLLSGIDLIGDILS